jgi:TPR repeat protein
MTPAERFKKDETGCGSGDKAACRALARRYSGTGPFAGCGVPRESAAPSLKRTPTDSPKDRLPFLDALTKACELGDKDACELVGFAGAIYAQHGTWRTHLGAFNGDPMDVGIWHFRVKEGQPDIVKLLGDRRVTCLQRVAEFECTQPDSTLFRKEKPPADGKLPAKLKAVAEEACTATRDCDDIYTVLDRNGFSPDELAPVRAAFAASLIEGCKAGDCTCGEATKYLPDGDAQMLDLAALGCENGEAEGCYALGRLYEEGRGVDKDERRAKELYDVACPPTRSRTQGLPMGEYSPRACDRLAELAMGGEIYPGKERARAKYYMEMACQHPGRERLHAPCVRLGMLWATKKASSGPGKNASEAKWAAWGGDDAAKGECSRPSVKAECETFAEAIKTVK